MARARARGQCYQLKTSEKDWAHLAKFEVLWIVDFWQFYKKGQLPQFWLFEGVIGLFRNLEMSSKQKFWSHINLVFHVHVWSFDPKGVFVDFSKWHIVSKFISSCECIFWTWELKMDYMELHPLQNEIWMGHFW